MTKKVRVALWSVWVVILTLFMTRKGHGVIRGRHDLLYDPKGQGDPCGRFDLVYDPKRSQGHWRSLRPIFDPIGHGDVCGQFDLIYDPKRSGVITGRRDLLYDPKGHGDLCGQFYLVYDHYSSRGHWRSPWPTLWPQRSGWSCCRFEWSVWPSLWPQNVKGSLEVAMIYIMTPKVRLALWSVWPR